MGFNLGSTPSNGQDEKMIGVQMGRIVRFKRTMPFEKQCCFIISSRYGEIERCDEMADFGLYVGTHIIKLISLCHYHTVFEESLLIGEKE
jgi:hypothetical protein